MYKDYRCGW